MYGLRYQYHTPTKNIKIFCMAIVGDDYFSPHFEKGGKGGNFNF